ncbi:MAG TPA: PAS domain-containing protein [Anaeromyxobacteraceae bacterium]|nr:PAS domain-containing protein [Anaeromyxobacteraceae bacterium]
MPTHVTTRRRGARKPGAPGGSAPGEKRASAPRPPADAGSPDPAALLAAMETLPVGVVIVERPERGQPVLVGHNAACRRICGEAMPPGTPVGEIHWSLYRPDRATRIAPGDWPVSIAAETGEAAAEAELHLRRRDGEWRVLLVSASPLTCDAGGGAGRALGILHDVTERRRAEEDLSRRGQLFRLVVETSPDPVFVKNRESQFLFANPAMLRTLGRRAGEVLGRRHAELDGEGEAARAIAESDRRVLESGREEVVEEVMRTAAGPRIFLTTKSPWRDSSGLVIGLIGLARDITERKRTEALLFQSQKLDSLGRLAGGVAHDFNNLLTVILCSVEAQQAALDAGQPVDREDVEQVRAAGERARDLTRHLLAFARKQANEPATVDLGEMVGRSEPLLRRMLREDVRLETASGAAPWPVRCDPARLEQVLVNLVVNARDAMPQGGVLQVSIENVSVAAADADLPGGDWVRLRVADSGTGMSPEVQEHLFEPFFTTKEAGGGTGGGLAIVYGIVRQAGGHVRVRSVPADGTTVDVFLPRAEPGAPQEPAAAPARSPSGSGSVLLVEDDASVREAAARALRGAGYDVVAAAGAEEATAAFRASVRAPAILVTDVIMPGSTGRELADRLRAERPGLQVLFLSGHSHELIGPHGVLEPGVAFLAKPFTASTLLAKVRAVLDAG